MSAQTLKTSKSVLSPLSDWTTKPTVRNPTHLLSSLIAGVKHLCLWGLMQTLFKKISFVLNYVCVCEGTFHMLKHQMWVHGIERIWVLDRKQWAAAALLNIVYETYLILSVCFSRRVTVQLGGRACAYHAQNPGYEPRQFPSVRNTSNKFLKPASRISPGLADSVCQLNK